MKMNRYIHIDSFDWWLWECREQERLDLIEKLKSEEKDEDE